MNWLRDKLAEILHNCIAHPLMPFLPRKWGNFLHDWTLKFWPPYHGDHDE